MDRLVGVFLIAVLASCFGAMAIFARLAYEAGTDPYQKISTLNPWV